MKLCVSAPSTAVVRASMRLSGATRPTHIHPDQPRSTSPAAQGIPRGLPHPHPEIHRFLSGTEDLTRRKSSPGRDSVCDEGQATVGDTDPRCDLLHHPQRPSHLTGECHHPVCRRSHRRGAPDRNRDAATTCTPLAGRGNETFDDTAIHRKDGTIHWKRARNGDRDGGDEQDRHADVCAGSAPLVRSSGHVSRHAGGGEPCAQLQHRLGVDLRDSALGHAECLTDLGKGETVVVVKN